MKYLWLIVFLAMLFLGGGVLWWWNSQKATDTHVFENTTLSADTLQSLPDSSQEVVRAEDTPHEETDAPVTPTSPSPVSQQEESPMSTLPVANTPLAVTDRLLSFGYRVSPSPRSIDTIVVHSSYNASGGDAFDLGMVIKQYEQYSVGAHYLIDRGGKIYRLVKENDIAYHAGESKMPDGRRNVNLFSIGIELIGTEDSGFTDKQYAALNTLIADIKTRYKITNIIGHSDIAPTRKTDPWQFDWKRLK